MEESEDLETAEDSTRGKRFWVPIFFVIVAIAVTLWLLPEQVNPPLDTPLKKPVPAPELQPLPKPVEETKATPELVEEAKAAPEIEIQAHPGDHAREIIARLGKDTVHTEEVFAEAHRQREAGRLEDAYLLYFYAAKQGHAESALILGAQADPAHFDPDGGVLREADPGQAYKWYRLAADNGSAEALSRLEVLLEKVKKSAAAGDEKADRLMLQWR